LSYDGYLHDQVRAVLERSGSFINDKGQLPHHFEKTKPVYQALSGATQTGPNVFWILSCLNYVKYSGDLEWLVGYMPTLRRASSFLFDLLDREKMLLNAPGSLYIDVFIRQNFTSDSNAMIVQFFRDFAEAERSVGNFTGAKTLRKLADRVAVGMNKWLFDRDTKDHFITQLNPDGTTRDFVDYDANFIALAHGVPNSTEAAKRIFNRLDGGRCTHGRPTFVSERYYGPQDCVHGNIGDSWCSMGRNGWFDALSRVKWGQPVEFFNSELIDPLSLDLRKWTWMHERYSCSGSPQRNRTWGYFEYPSVAAMMQAYIRYGIRPGIATFELRPFGPTEFFLEVGELAIFYSNTSCLLRVPSKQPNASRRVAIYGLLPSSQFSVEVGGCDSPMPFFAVNSSSDGTVDFTADIVDGKGTRCTVNVSLSESDSALP
jgi:hypothetical protein